MARISFFWKALSLCALAHAGLASAQQQPSPPAPPPPQLERIEPGSDVPETTLRSGPRTVITERRQNGQVVDVDVKSGASHYNMQPNKPAGNAQVGDAQSNAIRPPTWTLLQFGNAKKKQPADAAVPAAADAPPPPVSK